MNTFYIFRTGTIVQSGTLKRTSEGSYGGVETRFSSISSELTDLRRHEVGQTKYCSISDDLDVTGPRAKPARPAGEDPIDDTLIVYDDK